MEQIYGALGISPEVEKFGEEILKGLRERNTIREKSSGQCRRSGSMPTALPVLRATAIMIWGGIRWKAYTRPVFIQRRHWCARRLPAAHTR